MSNMPARITRTHLDGRMKIYEHPLEDNHEQKET